jgi:hypothetical protein
MSDPSLTENNLLPHPHPSALENLEFSITDSNFKNTSFTSLNEPEIKNNLNFELSKSKSEKKMDLESIKMLPIYIEKVSQNIKMLDELINKQNQNNSVSNHVHNGSAINFNNLLNKSYSSSREKNYSAIGGTSACTLLTTGGSNSAVDLNAITNIQNIVKKSVEGVNTILSNKKLNDKSQNHHHSSNSVNTSNILLNSTNFENKNFAIIEERDEDLISKNSKILNSGIKDLKKRVNQNNINLNQGNNYLLTTQGINSSSNVNIPIQNSKINTKIKNPTARSLNSSMVNNINNTFSILVASENRNLQASPILKKKILPTSSSSNFQKTRKYIENPLSQSTSYPNNNNSFVEVQNPKMKKKNAFSSSGADLIKPLSSKNTLTTSATIGNFKNLHKRTTSHPYTTEPTFMAHKNKKITSNLNNIAFTDRSIKEKPLQYKKSARNINESDALIKRKLNESKIAKNFKAEKISPRSRKCKCNCHLKNPTYENKKNHSKITSTSFSCDDNPINNKKFVNKGNFSCHGEKSSSSLKINFVNNLKDLENSFNLEVFQSFYFFSEILNLNFTDQAERKISKNEEIKNTDQEIVFLHGAKQNFENNEKNYKMEKPDNLKAGIQFNLLEDYRAFYNQIITPRERKDTHSYFNYFENKILVQNMENLNFETNFENYSTFFNSNYNDSTIILKNIKKIQKKWRENKFKKILYPLMSLDMTFNNLEKLKFDKFNKLDILKQSKLLLISSLIKNSEKFKQFITLMNMAINLWKELNSTNSIIF